MMSEAGGWQGEAHLEEACQGRLMGFAGYEKDA